MRSLVYSDLRAGDLFGLTYTTFVLLDVQLVLKSLAGRAAPETESVERGPVHRPSGLVWIIAAGAAGCALAAVTAFVLPWRWPLLVAGLAIAWAGLALRFAAKRTLGRFFVGAIVIQPGHRVVTDGPYSVIRHPGYAGSLIALSGLAIATANILTALLLIVVPGYVFVRTIQVEEAALVASLGQDYSAYRQRTARLIPHLW